MPTITRKRFLALGAALATGTALGAACADESSKGPTNGDDDDVVGDDDDDVATTAEPTPSNTNTPNPTPTPNPDCMANGTVVTIQNPHNHVMTVSVADVMAGVEKVYDIQGTSPHSHTVTLTAAHFQSLQMNMQVTVQSSLTGHTHNVTVRCAG